MQQRLLFVDDEPRILHGLQRMLYPLRNEWDMAFVGSGPEALACLAQAPFDVVVADMRMPGMDGVQLLSEVMCQYPQIVRIVLSGQADQETVLRAVEPTHRYLAKPCDPDTLKAAVSRTSTLRHLLNNSTLRRLVSGMKSLPSVPSLHLAVVKELTSPDGSFQKVRQLIAKDIGMTAKILHVVNSGFFGFRCSIEDLTEAISLLSFDVIKSLVHSPHAFSEDNEAKLNNFALSALSDHSFTVGVYARGIVRADHQGEKIREAAFTAGLLHDCGKLVLMSNLPEYYSKAEALAREQRLPLWKAEREIFGVTHAEVGAYLLGLWGLPDPLINALAYHHHPMSCPEQTFGPLTAVHVADALAHEAHTANTQPASAWIDLEYLANFGLADRLPLWQEQCRVLSETPPTCP